MLFEEPQKWLSTVADLFIFPLTLYKGPNYSINLPTLIFCLAFFIRAILVNVNGHLMWFYMHFPKD